MDLHISVLAGSITATLFGVNVFLAKKNLNVLSSNTHIFLKYLAVALFSLILSLPNWHLTRSPQALSLLLGLVCTRALFGYTYSKHLKHSNTAFVTLIVQSHVLLVAVMDLWLGQTDQFAALLPILLVFLAGLALILGVRASNISVNKLSFLWLLTAFTSLGIRPALVRPLLQESMTNSQTLLSIEFLAVSIVYLIIFKPDFGQLKPKLLMNYSAQGALSFIGNLSTNVGFAYGIATVTTMFLSMELVVVLILSAWLLNETMKRKQLAGMMICLLSFILLHSIY